MNDKSRSDLFERVVLPHLDDAYSLARWLTGDAADAEDIVQDACVRALGAVEKTQVSQPRAWLLAIVRNAAMNWLTKNRPRHLVLVDDFSATEANPPAALRDGRDPETILIAAAEEEQLSQAIAALPPLFRETLVMRDVNGLSYREIAAVSGVPIGTVMSRLARARDALATKLVGASRPRGAA
ncbi:sigma-70 family RNA polymerase sigma factor [Terrarubrum flagellatum]|uniref:sigma-70 family RNA polymerase sigma factor n=1 Tax=Terrirubrum flagellatum TaxID=2895980 RepID=UPI0031453814